MVEVHEFPTLNAAHQDVVLDDGRVLHVETV